jgi:hypothetical protein
MRVKIMSLFEKMMTSDLRVFLWMRRRFYQKPLALFWIGLALVWGSSIVQPLMLLSGIVLLLIGGGSFIGITLFRLLGGKRGRRYIDEWLIFSDEIPENAEHRR